MNAPALSSGSLDRSAVPQLRRFPPARLMFLLTFHALVSGGFIVAWFSGDEDTYLIHQLAGYLVLAAVVTRLLVAARVSKGPLALPRPSAAAVGVWLRNVLRLDRATLGRRGPLPAWLAAILLSLIAVTAVSGVMADSLLWMEGLHVLIANLTLWVVLAHIVIFAGLAGLKRLARTRS